MKKISNWTIVGYLAGIIFAVGSFIRYYIVYPDLDKALTDVLIGIIICALSWLYEQRLEHLNSITAIEEYLVDHRLETSTT